jgi:hypothetical protein
MSRGKLSFGFLIIHVIRVCICLVGFVQIMFNYEGFFQETATANIWNFEEMQRVKVL